MLPALDNVHDQQERLWLSLAKELAMDITPLETILKTNGIEPNVFETITKHPRFQALLQEQISVWASASNVAERVRLKMLAQVELTLPEMHQRLHDRTGGLTPAKVELFKTLMKGAGIGATVEGAGAEKVSIVINMGAAQVTAEAKLPSRVIEHEDVLDV